MVNRLSWKGLVFGVVGLFMVSPAFCAILPIDLSDAPGVDSFLTYDSATELDWLDVDQTKGTSFNSLVSGVAKFAALNGKNPVTDFGFRHATQIELTTLFQNAGIPDINDGFTALNFEPVNNLKALLGQTGNGDGPSEFLQAVTALSTSAGSHSFSIVQECRSLGINCSVAVSETGTFTSALAGTNLGEIDDDIANLAVGHFLVRHHAVVPVPATLPLFLTALAGFVFVTLRRKPTTKTVSSPA